MKRAFSEIATTEAWRAEVMDWAVPQLRRHGLRVLAGVDQPRVRAWSTQLTIPTDRGLVWFKACTPSMRFEPALQSLMADLVPGSVQPPLAIDAERGWMLTVDHGPTVGDHRTPTTDDWRSGVAAAARIQRALVDHAAELLATGLPDCRPETVVTRFDRLVTMMRELPEGHPAALDADTAGRLRERRTAVEAAVEVLLAGPLPTTWQHGDLHPWNMFGSATDLHVFDLGDGEWANAAEILAVPHGVIDGADDVDWPSVLDAWLAVWEVDADAFAPLWEASALTQAVNRTATWWSALAGATVAELAEFGQLPRHHLMRVLDG